MSTNGDAPPVAPIAPEPWECCQSGCDPCIYDRYWQAMERYETALRAWQERNQTGLPGTPRVDKTSQSGRD